LQAADILLYKADLIPVGEDQVQHLELSREICRRWNTRFDPAYAAAIGAKTAATTPEGEQAEVVGFFPEPKPLLTPTRRIMGLDGRAKMSKSLGNTIGLLEEPKDVWEKLRPAMTDPARVRKTDPGTPEICNIYNLHKAFSDPLTVENVAVQCRSAGWGCIDCKKVLFESMDAELTPIRMRARELRADPEALDAPLARGAEHAHEIASETLREAKHMMGLT
ncbi:MAG: tryptophan--tRNA ligase, partial [Gemmatimonadaceae bacterium]